MNINYEKQKHKIHNLWSEILSLIALEEELIKRIESLEETARRLENRLNETQNL